MRGDLLWQVVVDEDVLREEPVVGQKAIKLVVEPMVQVVFAHSAYQPIGQVLEQYVPATARQHRVEWPTLAPDLVPNPGPGAGR